VVTIDTLVSLISRDVALSYRILRAINTAVYGQVRPITSIPQAVRLLGVTAITRWTTLMLLTEIRDKPSELMTLAMVRAMMCEQWAQTLAPHHTDSCFLIGLFSVLFMRRLALLLFSPSGDSQLMRAPCGAWCGNNSYCYGGSYARLPYW